MNHKKNPQNTPPNLVNTPSLGSSSGSGSSSSSSQACAACKYQRRKCDPNCLLAPYFPADRQKDFLNAQKLFGVSNIKKVLNRVKQHERETAVRTMIFQANMRAMHPVGGCCHVIRELESCINLYKMELQFVHRQIAIYRAQAQAQAIQDEIEKIDCYDQKLGFDDEEEVEQVVNVNGTDGRTWDDDESCLVEKMKDVKPMKVQTNHQSGLCS